MPEPVEALVGLARALRARGATVTPAQVTTCAHAAARLVPDQADGLYWAGRLTLVSRREDLALYDQLFSAWQTDGFASGPDLEPDPGPDLGPDPGPDPGPGSLPPPATDDTTPGPPAGSRQPDDAAHAADLAPQGLAANDDTGTAEPVRATASAVERLRRTPLAACSPDELDAVASYLAALRVGAPDVPRRRHAPARRGRRIDLRATVRHSLRPGTSPVALAWHRPRRRPRRLVLLLDVSGSMSATSRPLMALAHAVVRARPRAEAFCFGTRLTRVTRELAARSPDDAINAAMGKLTDWSGGTRIAAGLRTFVRDWGRAGVARGADIVICSDGLERGEVEPLSETMAALARLAHRIIWVSPLAGGPGFEPSARGLRAALPHVDVLMSGRDLASLEQVAAALQDNRLLTVDRSFT